MSWFHAKLPPKAIWKLPPEPSAEGSDLPPATAMDSSETDSVPALLANTAKLLALTVLLSR